MCKAVWWVAEASVGWTRRLREEFFEREMGVQRATSHCEEEVPEHLSW